MDAVQQANSGHPARPWAWPMSRWRCGARHLRHNPANPHWADRDRFVLSTATARCSICALLHLAGYDLPMSELRNFRQLHSKTPGHPNTASPRRRDHHRPARAGHHQRRRHGAGREVAGRTEFNRPGHAIVDHHTHAFLGDGCLMEGISHEACAWPAPGSWAS